MRPRHCPSRAPRPPAGHPARHPRPRPRLPSPPGSPPTGLRPRPRSGDAAPHGAGPPASSATGHRPCRPAVPPRHPPSPPATAPVRLRAPPPARQQPFAAFPGPPASTASATPTPTQSATSRDSRHIRNLMPDQRNPHTAFGKRTTSQSAVVLHLLGSEGAAEQWHRAVEAFRAESAGEGQKAVWAAGSLLVVLCGLPDWRRAHEQAEVFLSACTSRYLIQEVLSDLADPRGALPVDASQLDPIVSRLEAASPDVLTESY